MPESPPTALVEMQREGGGEPAWARRVAVDGSAWERTGGDWRRLGQTSPAGLALLTQAIQASGVLDLPDEPVAGEILSDAARERWLVHADDRERRLDLRGAHRSAVPQLVALDEAFQVAIALSLQAPPSG